MRKLATRPWDAAEHLTTPAAIAAYLNAAMEENDPDLFLAALSDVARARGIGEVARESGLGRQSLYKALSPGSKPRYDTLFKVLHGLGVKLAVEA